ncbi:MAG: regulatory protein RecX [Solirubrobacterales bacterium]
MSASQDRRLQDVLGKALGALRRRERTSRELHSWLRGRGCDEDLAEEVIAELIELGELDDERFAFAYAADKRELSGWGAHRIAAALTDRGIGAGLAERAAAEPREQELERAVALVAAKGEDLADERGRARALSHLTRRGYEYELAYDAVRRAGEGGSRAA